MELTGLERAVFSRSFSTARLSTNAFRFVMAKRSENGAR